MTLYFETVRRGEPKEAGVAIEYSTKLTASLQKGENP